MDNTREITLERLIGGLPGITPTFGAVHAEACLVCLALENHATGVLLEVNGSFDQTFRLLWSDKVTEQMYRTWADTPEATETAACGIAFLLILELTDYTIIERSRKGTGFDYWLDYKDALPFQKAARLEVSGIQHAEHESEITARVKQKLQQTDRSNTGLPAYIIVVEFSRPMSHVVRK